MWKVRVLILRKYMCIYLKYTFIRVCTEPDSHQEASQSNRVKENILILGLFTRCGLG